MLSKRRNLLLSFVLLGVAPLVSAAEPVYRPKAAAEVWARTELYFGTNRVAESPVSDTDFQSFVEQEVTPRFPDGLTLLTGNGQFRTSAGEIIREKAFLLILLYPPQTIQTNRSIQEIRERYKTMFQQESVLRVDNFSYVSF